MPSFIPPHKLTGLPPETPILLALSGGADSRSLLHMLLADAAKTGSPLSVAHVDHGIRGETSARDREFCRRLAADAGIPFYCLEADIPALAAANRLGLEEQARRVRYDFFETVMRREHIPVLATAHNATDNAETLLFRMARGTGLAGLCGIPASRPVPGGILIRPLLDMTKEDILDYCREHSLTYVTDETNDDTAYARNRVRHNILPELTALNAEAVRHISALAHVLREDESCLSAMAESFLENSRKDGKEGVPAKELLALPPAIANRVLALLFGEPPLSAAHRDALLALADRAVPHSSVNLPGGRIAGIEGGRLLAVRDCPASPSDYRIPVKPGVTSIPGTDAILVIDTTDKPYELRDSVKNIYKNSTTTEVSSDRISNGLFVRPREPGDVIVNGGMHKKVRKLQSEAGLPLALRNRLPLLCDGAGVLWIPFSVRRDGAAQGAPYWRITLFFHEKS